MRRADEATSLMRASLRGRPKRATFPDFNRMQRFVKNRERLFPAVPEPFFPEHRRPSWSFAVARYARSYPSSPLFKRVRNLEVGERSEVHHYGTLREQRNREVSGQGAGVRTPWDSAWWAPGRCSSSLEFSSVRPREWPAARHRTAAGLPLRGPERRPPGSPLPPLA